MAGMTVIGTLIVVRPKRWIDRGRGYDIVIDGAVRGSVRSGAELAIAVAPGTHTAQGRLDRTGSPEVPFHIGPGAQVRMLVEPQGNPLTAPWYVFGADRYLRLVLMDESVEA
jgi:hypothetical protein